MVDNDDRAEWAGMVLLEFSRMTGLKLDAERDDAISDLICNLGHYCDRHNLPFLELAARAIAIWDVEKREEDSGEPNALYPEKTVVIQLLDLE